MTATYDKTSFGERRKRCLVTELTTAQKSVDDRLLYVEDDDKRARLELLRSTIDIVLTDLNE